MVKAITPSICLLAALFTATAVAQSPPETPAAETPATDSQRSPTLPGQAKADVGADGKLQPALPGSGAAQASGFKVAELPGLTPLSKSFGLWMDLKRKWVVIDGKVCLNQGVLEMFACSKGTKEHESLIAIDCPARFVHAALLAVGAKPGQPVRFDPEYSPATGQKIDVYMIWVDQDGRRRSARAQEWVRNTKTKKQMKHSFVFAGSDFWEETVDGKPYRHYQADAGDFICVSNFPSATLDLPIESSKENSQLLFEAYPDRIPTRGTRIRVVLIPRD